MCCPLPVHCLVSYPCTVQSQTDCFSCQTALIKTSHLSSVPLLNTQYLTLFESFRWRLSLGWQPWKSIVLRRTVSAVRLFIICSCWTNLWANEQRFIKRAASLMGDALQSRRLRFQSAPGILTSTLWAYEGILIHRWTQGLGSIGPSKGDFDSDLFGIGNGIWCVIHSPFVWKCIFGESQAGNKWIPHWWMWYSTPPPPPPAAQLRLTLTGSNHKFTTVKEQIGTH